MYFLQKAGLTSPRQFVKKFQCFSWSMTSGGEAVRFFNSEQLFLKHR